MEFAGLSLGVFPVFSACLEYFHLFKTAKAASRESQILLYKLDCEYENFIIWGVKNGFCKTDVDGQILALQPPEVPERLKRGLDLIEQLLCDAAVLREKYGFSQLGSNNDINSGATENTEASAPAKKKRRTKAASFNNDATYPSSSALKRIKWWKTRDQPENPKLDIVRKSMWAINDRDKFERLVKNLHDLIQKLYDILPVNERDRNTLAVEDIKSLSGDLDDLKLFEEASSNNYPAWSIAASLIIEVASTVGKRGPGTISQWMANIENETESDLYADKPKNEASPLPKQERQTNGFTLTTTYTGQLKWIFAFTPECHAAAIGTSCDTEQLEITPSGPSFLFQNDLNRQWGLRNLVNQIINAKRHHAAKIEGWARNGFPDEIQEALIEASYPAMIINVYCPPCRCSLRTALMVCDEHEKLIEYRIRVDDRLPASCCTNINSDKLQRMEGMAKTLYDFDGQLSKNYTKDGLYWGLLDFLDRPWLEQRLHDLQARIFESREPPTTHQQIGDFLASISDPEQTADKISSIIIIEATQGAWILQTSPFSWKPIPPTECQMFLVSRTAWGADAPVRVKFYGTFTAYRHATPHSSQFMSSKRRSPGSVTSMMSMGGLTDIRRRSTSEPTANPGVSPPSSIEVGDMLLLKKGLGNSENDSEDDMAGSGED